MNTSDPRLRCTASGVSRFTLKKPNLSKSKLAAFDLANGTAVLAALGRPPMRGVGASSVGGVFFEPAITTSDMCTEFFPISVPLGPTRRGKPTQGVLKIRAIFEGPAPAPGRRGVRDLDSLHLVCYPPP
jgi:hypothetical protein